MTAAQPPIDQDVLVGLRQGDDRSLEQLFRDRYPALVQEASTQLDDPGGAPRVVEKAFLRVWDERQSFETRQALDSFLHTAVHDGAIRERKRLATLHRLEDRARVNVQHHAKTVNADEAWSHLKAAIHAADSPEAHAAARAQVSTMYRHDAAEHVASIGKRRIPWGMLAIGAGVAILVAAPLWWAERSGTDAAATRALASPNARVVSTVTGQRASVTLLDNSQAALGADTKLTIAPEFGATVRAIKLEGAALFTVSPGGKHEFYVRAGDATVTAAGTTFGVHAYPGDETIVVGAREGSVHVEAENGERDVQAPRGVVITKEGEIRDASPAELEEALGWTEERFAITDRPLSHAIKQINRWYAIDLVVRDSALLTRPVSVKASLQASGDAIAALEKTGKLKFGYENEGKTRVLSDAGGGRK
jgi:ferric-dicitrate binding protein FerR (iron transport regulator)